MSVFDWIITAWVVLVVVFYWIVTPLRLRSGKWSERALDRR